MKNLSKSILAVLSLCLVLAACGKTDRPNDTEDTTKVQETTVDTTTTATDTTAVKADTTAAE